MADIRNDLSVQRERALLVGVVVPGSTADPMDPIGELRSLAQTAGAHVVDEMLARCRSIKASIYVGTGKAQEIADRAAQNKVDVVIFDNDLSPNQIRELEEIIKIKVIDRSELILDIFAAHASSAESSLQVELAQLEYTYPRLHHMWSHLERIAGGASTGASAVGGIGTRGPGEKQLEIDRRLVQKRGSYLKQKIAQIDKRKVRAVEGRKDTFNVCLVGYTNAGKSTLMNLLTGADTYVADKLFATLETKTRRWKISERSEVLLSDTVGFIRNLPHHLVASFKATLEEAVSADLLLHVADASHDRVSYQIETVNQVLDDIGCPKDNRLLVLNKIDRITDPTVKLILARKYKGSVFISAVTGEGAGDLATEVTNRSAGASVRVLIQADCRNGRLMQYIARHVEVQSQRFEDATAHIEAVIEESKINDLRNFGNSVKVTSVE